MSSIQSEDEATELHCCSVLSGPSRHCLRAAIIAESVGHLMVTVVEMDTNPIGTKLVPLI